MYSVGNEICEGFDPIAPLEEFSDTARELAGIVADEDPTRPATNANNNPANYTNGYPGVLPIMGCNYYPWVYPELKRLHPAVPFFGSETICMSSTRGEYHFPVSQKWSEACGACGKDFYNSSYCWEATGWEKLDGNWACAPDAQWYWMDQVRTCMGEFIWTGIDYLGGPYWCDGWRRQPSFTDPEKQKRALEEVASRGFTRAAIHSCNLGFLDTAGFRKDSFWLFQSRWRPYFKMAHILPHWNWVGREGEITPVYVFTSADEGELFLNGRSLGRRRKEPGVWNRAYRLRWDDVRYEPGVLEVVTYKDGAEWARDKVETTGAPCKLELEAETSAVAADGEDICYVNASVRDSRGRVVPTAGNGIAFSIEGPGEIVATDNGDETDFDDFRQPVRKAFHGWAQVIVRAIPGTSGTIRIKACSEGLMAASVQINS
jgi:beta-galactosidase